MLPGMGGVRVVTAANGLGSRCDLLQSLHRPGAPLVLPNAWDAASPKAVAAAGFPAVATTSGGVAAALGDEDHEGGRRVRCSPRRRGSPAAPASR
jgi:Phosphoenolpyruvate phosphomutase